MARSADAICEKLARIGAPTVLLGHSMGGYSITAGAEKAPELVSRMIYLSAWVPPIDGRSMASTDAKFGSIITGPRVKPAVKWRPLRGVIDLDPARGPSFLCQLADQEAQSFLMSVTNPQPIRPGLSRVRWSEARLGRIPKIYVECTQDEAIPLDGQRHFQANATFADVLSLDSDHAPQVSMPAALADVISQAMG